MGVKFQCKAEVTINVCGVEVCLLRNRFQRIWFMLFALPQ